MGAARLAGVARDLPVIVAPMFRVSSPAMVVAACNAGAVGAFPALNARSTEALAAWLDEIQAGLDVAAAPWAVNLITHRSNPRFQADLELVAARRAPVLISSVGAPDAAVAAVHAYGGMVLADVASLAHARRAAAAGVDGLVLLCCGAGGQTGRLNPFAFLEAVREFYDGLVVVAGGITTGRQLKALQALGADLAYVGTPFVACAESLAPAAYQTALIAADIDDVYDTDAVSGIPGNVLAVTLEKLGLTPKTRWVQAQAAYDWQAVRYDESIFSAGHGVGAVRGVEPCGVILERLRAEYRAA